MVPFAPASAPVAAPVQVSEEDVDWQRMTAFRRISRGFQSGRLTIKQGLLEDELRERGGVMTPQMRDELNRNADEINALGGNGPGYLSWASATANAVGSMVQSTIEPFKKVHEKFTDPNPSLSTIQQATEAIDAVGEAIVLPIGMWETMNRTETGGMYKAALDAGVSHDTANIVAQGVGAINASLDMVGLVGATKPLAAGVKSLLKTTTKKAMSDPRVLAWAGKAAKAWGTSVASEVSTEVMQEVVTLTGEQTARAIEGIEGVDPDEALERIVGVAIDTFKAMAILGVAGGAAEFASARKNSIRAKTHKDAVGEVKQLIADAPDPEIAKAQVVGAMEAQGLTNVWISAEAVVEEAEKSGNPQAYYEAMGVSDQVQEAALLGGDVRVPWKTYADMTQWASFQGIIDHVRYDRDGLTIEESKDTSLQSEIEALGGEIEEEMDPGVLAKPKEGTIRFYHGGDEKADPTGYAAFVSPDPEYARLYKTNEDAENKVWFVDIPVEEAERLGLLDPEGRPQNGQLELETSKGMKPFDKPVVEGAKPEPSVETQIEEELFGMQAFFKSAKDAGMTDKQYEAYLAAIARSREAKGKKLEAIGIRKKLRENQADIKAIKEELAEVAREIVDNQPVYAALNGIGRERLDADALAKVVGAETMEKLPRVNGRQIYEKGGQVDPEVYADMYGFEGADIMVFAILDNPSRETAIKNMQEKLFAERYIGMTQRQQDLEAQLEATHNDESATVLAFEVNQLREAIGQKRLKPRILKLAARQRIRDYKLDDIKPQKFLAAEKKAATQARKLLRKGDRAGAAKAKFQQLLNFQFALEAYRVRQRVVNDRKYLSKFQKKPKPGAKLPIDYFMAIRTMMGELSFKKPSLQDFVVQMEQEDGIVIEIPLRMRQSNGKTYFLNMTLQEWESLVYTVRGVERTGLEENKLIREGEKQTREQIVDGVVASAEANLKGGSVYDETDFEKKRLNGRQLSLLAATPQTLFAEADGFTPLGPVYSALKRPYDRAMSEGYQPGQVGFMERYAKESKKLNELQNIYTKGEQVRMKKNFYLPGVRERLSHQKVIMVLLNSGNMDNRMAMVDSKQFTEAEIEIILQNVSEKDVKFAQGIWDFFETFWPEVVDSTKRRRNLIPEKVEARPVETNHGTLRGGYFPLIYKNKGLRTIGVAEATSPAQIREALKFGSFVQSMTRHGHTIDRVGNRKQKLNLEMFDINRHVQQVVYDLEMGDAVLDIYKILFNRRVQQTFEDLGQMHRWHQMELWFANVVMGEMHSAEAFEKMARWARTSLVMTQIGFKVSTALLQPTGLLQTATRIGKYNTLYGISTMLYNPRLGRAIRQQSGFMRHRQASFNTDIMMTQEALKTNWIRRITPGRSAELTAAYAFWMIMKLQGAVDQVTWVGAKRKGMQLFNDEAKAIEYADNMVREAQGSGLFGDRSPFERGSLHKKMQQSDLVRSLTMLQGYFITKNNVAYQRIRTTNYRNPLSVLNTGFDLFLTYVVETWISALIGGALGGALLRGDDPEDVEGKAMALAWWSLFQGFPVANWIAAYGQGYTGGGAIPAVEERVADFLVQVSQGELDEAFFRSAARVAGIMTRVPGTAQAVTLGQAGFRAANGEDVNAMEVLIGPQWRE